MWLNFYHWKVNGHFTMVIEREMNVSLRQHKPWRRLLSAVDAEDTDFTQATQVSDRCPFIGLVTRFQLVKQTAAANLHLKGRRKDSSVARSNSYSVHEDKALQGLSLIHI